VEISDRLLVFDDIRFMRMLRGFSGEVGLYKHVVVESGD